MFIDFFLIFYLFLGRQEGREKKRREASMCDCLSHAPDWGPGPQPRHVPWLENEPVSLWFAGWCSVHWATPARACLLILERGEGRLRERERERNKDVREKCWLVASYMHPKWGSNLQPEYMPWAGVKQATFRCRDDAPTDQATDQGEPS